MRLPQDSRFVTRLNKQLSLIEVALISDVERLSAVLSAQGYKLVKDGIPPVYAARMSTVRAAVLANIAEKMVNTTPEESFLSNLDAQSSGAWAEALIPVIRQPAVALPSIAEQQPVDVLQPVQNDAEPMARPEIPEIVSTAPRQKGGRRQKSKNIHEEHADIDQTQLERMPAIIDYVKTFYVINDDGLHDDFGISRDNEPTNYKITNELDRSSFMPTERCDVNIAAINILNNKADGVPFTDAEKRILAGYSGWGGLARYFDHDAMTSEPDKRRYLDIRNGMDLLDDGAYWSARSSTLNAHYTSPEVVKALWSTARAVGFDGGKILESSVGTGNFIGLMPQETFARPSRWVAIEKDVVTARIAKALYAKETVLNSGFEAFYRSNNDFNLAITNVPFSEVKVYDVGYDMSMSLHDYFIRKNLDHVQQGAPIIMMTSTGTLDKSDDTARRELLRQALFVSAIRLPSGSFKAIANTDVVIDTIVMIKRPEPLSDEALEVACKDPQNAEWINSRKYKIIGEDTGQEQDAYVSCYFDVHPECMMGEYIQENMQAGRLSVGVSAHKNWIADMNDWAASLAMSPAVAQGALWREAIRNVVPVYSDAARKLNGMHGFADHEISGFFDYIPEWNTWFQVSQNDYGEKSRKPLDLATYGTRQQSIALGYAAIRNALIVQMQNENANLADEVLDAGRAKLRFVYDEFVTQHGPLSTLEKWPDIVADDNWFGSVESLEIWDKDTKSVSRLSDIMTSRVIKPLSIPDQVETPQQALALSLSVYGSVDIDFIARKCGESHDTTRNDLLSNRLIFKIPGGGYEPSSQYLSGDIKNKIKLINEAIEDPETPLEWVEWYRGNLEALIEVMPEPKRADYIRDGITPGAPWIPKSYLKEFLPSLGYAPSTTIVDFEYSETEGVWSVRPQTTYVIRNLDFSKFSTSHFNPLEILGCILNRKTPKAYDKIGDSRVFNFQETIKATQAAARMVDTFKAFMLDEDDKRCQTVVDLYNDTFNGFVEPVYDGSSLEFPGMNQNIVLRSNQRNIILRNIIDGCSYAAHEVGTGKTFSQVATAIEWKRYGICRKPCILVKNNMIKQFAADARRLYPMARVLTISKEDLTPRNRAKFLGMVANNDWDMVIMTHSVFTRIPLSISAITELSEAEIQRTVDDMGTQMDSEARVKGRSMAKSLARAVDRQRRKLEKCKVMLQKPTVGPYWEHLGIDGIIIDEAHNFKNLELKLSGSMYDTPGSQKAFDLLTKLDTLRATRGDNKGIMMASGTPISNRLHELFIVQRYIMPDILESYKMRNINAWCAQFIGSNSEWIPSVTGDGFQQREIQFYINASILQRMARIRMDPATSESAGIDLPDVNRILLNAEMDTYQIDTMADIIGRAAEVKSGNVEPEDDNMLSIVGDGSRISIDPRLCTRYADNPLIYPDHERALSYEHPDSKVSLLCNEAARLYQETSDNLGVQLIFCDSGVNQTKGKMGFHYYHHIRDQLVQAGIPLDEIVIFQDFSSDEEKEIMIQDVRDGKKRILIGSTFAMGEGMNAQDRIVGVYNVDIPYRPSDMAQREGRGVRFGNMNKTVNLYYLVTSGPGRHATVKSSLDAYRYDLVNRKARSFSDFMFAKINDSLRRLDLDTGDLSYAEFAAAATGDPRLKLRLQLDSEIQLLKAEKSAHFDDIRYIKSKINSEKNDKDSIESVLTHAKNVLESLTDMQKNALIAYFSACNDMPIVQPDGTTREPTKSDLRVWVPELHLSALGYQAASAAEYFREPMEGESRARYTREELVALINKTAHYVGRVQCTFAGIGFSVRESEYNWRKVKDMIHKLDIDSYYAFGHTYEISEFFESLISGNMIRSRKNRLNKIEDSITRLQSDLDGIGDFSKTDLLDEKIHAYEAIDLELSLEQEKNAVEQARQREAMKLTLAASVDSKEMSM